MNIVLEDATEEVSATDRQDMGMIVIRGNSIVVLEALEKIRELVFKEEGQEYASVTKMLGNGWIEAQCMDGEKRLGHIRGAFRKKVWIAAGDLVLLGLRDYQDSKADIILKYTADEARLLKSYGELPDNVKVNENDVGGESEDDVDVEFDIDDVSLDCFQIWLHGVLILSRQI
ncbi:Translation initiation factor 1A [Chytriomyces hyalinus]|nr:Translation initiation factor 1A [Chytriomyces hyalinus]